MIRGISIVHKFRLQVDISQRLIAQRLTYSTIVTIPDESSESKYHPGSKGGKYFAAETILIDFSLIKGTKVPNKRLFNYII